MLREGHVALFGHGPASARFLYTLNGRGLLTRPSTRTLPAICPLLLDWAIACWLVAAGSPKALTETTKGSPAISKETGELFVSFLLTYIPFRILDKLVQAANRSKIVIVPLVLVHDSRLGRVNFHPANRVNSHKNLLRIAPALESLNQPLWG